MSDNLYKLFCITEEKVVKVWGPKPTVCPHNSVHEIALDSVRVDENFNNTIIAAENTYGDFETEPVNLIVPAGTPGDVTEHDVSWDMDILLWLSYLKPTSDMIGDSITVVAAPETTIGGVTAPISIGDTTISVNPGIFQYVKRGYLITLDDGVNKDVVGRCTAVDSINNTISFKNPTTYAFSPGIPVKMSIYIIKDMPVIDTDRIPIAQKGMKGKNVPQGTIIRVYYTNNSGTSKNVYWRPEYYNNG